MTTKDVKEPDKSEKRPDYESMWMAIVFGLVIPIFNITRHLLWCPMCSDCGLNPFCLAKCLWSIPFGILFLMLFLDDSE